jgi:5-carboxyvanillate decarboxylase
METRVIATEEAFAPPELLDLWRRYLASGELGDEGFESLWGYFLLSQSQRTTAVVRRLQDVGDGRLAQMDEAGVDHQILSLTSPGVQVLPVEEACAMAEFANDFVADACARAPSRFSALAAVTPRAPAHAAGEIQRAVDALGLRGVIINSHTRGLYLDDPGTWDILEAAEDLDVPIYLHPNTPSNGLIGPMREAGVDGAIFGFAVETGLHLLRIVLSGALDRFPRLRIVVGHLGEALPFWMYRMDHMHAAAVASDRHPDKPRLRHKPSDYLRENIWLTTSGMAWEPVIEFVRTVVGPERVMYAMDYPFQTSPAELRLQADMEMSEDERRDFLHGTAERVFGLNSRIRLSSSGLA